MKPLAVDLCCGLGGWSEGLLAEGYQCVGFDIERHDYGTGGYPAQLVLQDVLTIHGSQFKDASLIVASPPCQEYSYMAMPWSRAKAIAAEYRSGARDTKKLTALFDACFRIQREAIEAAGHFIPLIVENVRGAQPWVGRSRWNFGSFHLWGDVPALMPMTGHKLTGHKLTGHKLTGHNLDKPTAGEDRKWHATKNTGGSWFNVAHNTTSGVGRNPDGRKVPATSRDCGDEGTKVGGDWFDERTPGCRAMMGSKSPARKAASAAIAKIPFPLARHIARVWKPQEQAA